MFLRFLKVSGFSLAPAYRDGDYVLVSSIPIRLKGIRPGDAVVFRYPSLGTLIKLVERLEGGGNTVYVVGLDEDSVDSRIFGAIPRTLIQGKVIWHISKK